MPRHEQRPAKAAETAIILLALAVCFLRLIAILFPDARLWGINHLLFLPGWFSIVYGLLAIAAIARFVSPFRRWAGRAFTAVADNVVSAPRYPIWAVIVLSAGVLFWIFRMPTHFLGDGCEVIQNLSTPSMALHKWTEQGAIAFVALIARILPLAGEQLGEYAYAFVSVGSGVITIFFFLGIAYESSKDAAMRLFAFVLLIGSGWLLLFFGYAENYPILWPFAAGYIYFSLRYLAGKSSLLRPTLCLAAAIALHLMAAVFLLSYPILLVGRGVGARIYQKHKTACKTAASLALVVAVALFAFKCQTALEFRLRFLPLIHGWPKNPSYAVLSLSHLGDILNFFFLTVPLWPAMVVMAVGKRHRAAADPVGRFLAMFSIGGLIFLLLVDPKLGLPRDWDLFALTAFGPMLYFIHRSHGFLSSHKTILPGLLGCAILAAAPYIAANLNESASVKYASSLLRLDPPVAKSGMVQMAAYYHAEGKSARADSLSLALGRQFPEIGLLRKAHELVADGRLDEAQRIVNTLTRIDPYSGELYYLRGMIALGQDDYAAAVEDFEQLARLSPYDFAVYVNLGGAYAAMGRDDRAMANFYRAYALNPESPDVLDELAMAFLRRKIYDSALFYGGKALAVDSRSLIGALAVGLAAAEMGDTARAIFNLTRYVETVPSGKWRDQARAVLARLRGQSIP